MERHLFAGSNTSIGFVSFFDNIFDDARQGRLLIIKGGSGVGKGTLLKKIGEKLSHYDNVEYYHCSGDSLSLDGIYSPKYNIGAFDGTSPHVMEPKYSGVRDEIINLGRFIDKNKLLPYYDDIVNTVNMKKYYYSLAYEYLGVAGKIESVNAKIINSTLNYNVIDGEISKFVSTYENTNKQGRIRKVFQTAITPEGVVTFDEYENKCFKKIFVYSSNKYELNYFFQNVSQNLLFKGYDIDIYYNELLPNVINSIYIKDTNESVQNGQSNITIATAKPNKQDLALIKANDTLKENFILNCVSELKKAKSVHKSLEKYYISSMDWEKVNDYSNEIIDSVSQQLL